MDFVKRQLNWKFAVVIAIIAVMGFYVYPAVKYKYFYDGEMVLLNGIYHKDKCDFIKDVKVLRLSPNAYWAVASGHRPCNSCKPPYVTPEELEHMKK